MLKALFGAALVASASWAGADDRSRQSEAELAKAVAALEREDCTAVLASTARLKKMPDFARLSEHRLVTLQMSAVCHDHLADKDAAYADARLATAMDGSIDQVWLLRLDGELRAKDWPALVTTTEAIAKDRPLLLNGLSLAWLNHIDIQLRSAGQEELRRRYLAVLADSAYWPDEPGGSNEGFRQRYALLLADAGEHEKAFELARLLTNPYLLISLSLDPRFRPALGDTPDVRAATERHLAHARTQVDRFPHAIRPVIDVADDLRLLGRPKEALAVLQSIEPAVTGDASLQDRDDQAIWWWDAMSRAHHAAGNQDAALAALRTGSAMKEGNGPNVSLTINLANLQLVSGDPAGAIRTLEAADAPGWDASPYGTMQVVTVRGCANFRQKATANADKDFAYAREHQGDAADAVTDLYLCRGDMDGAAASMIARLKNKDQRLQALQDLSTFEAPPNALPRDPMVKAMEALRQRPDVQAAAQQAGGTRHFNIQRPGF